MVGRRKGSKFGACLQWIDRKVEGQSELPADGIGAAAMKSGLRHVPLTALQLGYIAFAHTQNGAMAGLGTKQQCPLRPGWGCYSDMS